MGTGPQRGYKINPVLRCPIETGTRTELILTPWMPYCSLLERNAAYWKKIAPTGGGGTGRGLKEYQNRNRSQVWDQFETQHVYPKKKKKRKKRCTVSDSSLVSTVSSDYFVSARSEGNDIRMYVGKYVQVFFLWRVTSKSPEVTRRGNRNFKVHLMDLR